MHATLNRDVRKESWSESGGYVESGVEKVFGGGFLFGQERTGACVRQEIVRAPESSVSLEGGRAEGFGDV